jgi:hypothetical protein
MIKCPICQFENEDGALFCDQCKSDLATTEPIPSQAAPAAAWEAAAVKPDSHIPAAVLEASPPLVAVAVAEVTPVESGAAVSDAVPPVAIAEAVPLSEEIPIVQPIDAAPPAHIEEAVAVETKAFDNAAVSAAPVAAVPVEPPAPAVTARPKLVVLRGQRVNAEYPLYEGDNYIGRADDQAVDVDLEDQEPPDRVWSSRQHALIILKDGQLNIEDLKSTNGTFVNRMRLHPGQKRPLQVNDVIQIGTVQLKVTV